MNGFSGHAPSPPSAPAERACRFILQQVEAREGRCAYQGKWPSPLATGVLSPAVRLVAEQRIRRVPLAVARALVLWAEGANVALFEDIPSPLTVLRLQSRGARCVSLLPDHVATAPHEDALAFALHDLCHLDKFLDPEHHVGQIGFFFMVARAQEAASWRSFAEGFDRTLASEWDHVISDMNGSSVFLFAAMKMKLKMAVRRRHAREHGAVPPATGVLSREENTAYEDAQRRLLELLGLGGELAVAANHTSAKRSEPIAATMLLRHFEAIGRVALATAHHDDGRSICNLDYDS